MATNTETSANKYSIGNFKYPIGAGRMADMPHTVVFYINVRGNSISKTTDNTLFELTPAKIEEIGGAQAAVTGGAVAKAIGLAGAGAVAGGVIKNLSANAVSRKIMGGTAPIAAITSTGLKALTATAGTAAASVVSGTALGATALALGVTKMYRLKDAITLAVQEPMRTSYNVEYEDYDVGTLIGGSNSGASLENLGLAGILKGAQIPASIGAPDFARGIQKMAGKSINPFKTVLFKQVDLRTFTFNYKFMPASKEEAQVVMNIIKTFKYHMHPEFANDKVFLTHPSEFNIQFQYNNIENDKWNKISTCVLTSMELDSGTEQLASFADGMSVEINMKLTFKETEMLTKEKIEKGY